MKKKDKIWAVVVGATDGDTLTVEVKSRSRRNRYDYGTTERVRIKGVNAPELGEPGGKAAKTRLGKRLVGRRVGLVVHTRDKYTRVVADVVPA